MTETLTEAGLHLDPRIFMISNKPKALPVTAEAKKYEDSNGPIYFYFEYPYPHCKLDISIP